MSVAEAFAAGFVTGFIVMLIIECFWLAWQVKKLAERL